MKSINQWFVMVIKNNIISHGVNDNPDAEFINSHLLCNRLI